MEEDDKVMQKEQNELSENLNHWDYIDRYSRWMYHTYEAYMETEFLMLVQEWDVW